MSKLTYRLLPADTVPVSGETDGDRKVWTISELTRNVRFTLERGFTGIWVEGEISNFKFHSSGHMYFSMKDEEAQVSCVMFRRENAALGFELADGVKVVCFGRVSVYAPRGQYQLYVERVEPKGIGALQMRFERLKEKLRLEGLFQEERKRRIPFLPARIAVVTSTDGAALRDILNVLYRRYATAHLLIYPVPVQGAQAAPMIAEAIMDLNANDAADVMILARGGGSLEDLWAFNEESVARAIAASGIPVISAIGHETDLTIADLVADLRAPTPSAAAELVLPPREELLGRLEELRSRSSLAVLDLLVSLKEALQRSASSRALKDPLYGFDRSFQRLDELSKGLNLSFQNLFRTKRQEGARLAGQLEALGPLSTIKRGFSVTSRAEDGSLIRSVSQVSTGGTIVTRLQDGTFTSRVTEVKHGG